MRFIYGVTTDGFTYRDLAIRVESVRSELFAASDVGKVDLIGVQNDSVYVDFQNARASGGAAINTRSTRGVRCSAQKAVSASGILEPSRGLGWLCA